MQRPVGTRDSRGNQKVTHIQAPGEEVLGEMELISVYQLATEDTWSSLTHPSKSLTNLYNAQDSQETF